ncbi:MAG: RsmE family RNA methyltransferase [Planctomycetota bacterium]|jgi:16S rRNA (uracil1498-N3)-methyltransferase|nr:RsmE family RNA methyltransferase [Planctomycetota bacterium]|tara:strand:+ start:883 stop:1593 length:711 start_codon:yes stop_codon:yes gene_type:complete
MSHRFFLSQTPTEDTARLEGDEARHLARVMRAKTGDTVELFDGQGTSWTATVQAIQRNHVSLRLDQKQSETISNKPIITLAVALPKGDRQKWLIEKITELGTDSLVPLTTTRSVAEPTAAAISRLQRGVIESCKQSGRNRLLEITQPQSLHNLLTTSSASLRILACPDGTPMQSILLKPIDNILIAIGPEGGFTDEEIRTANASGFAQMSLCQNILRIETAAIAAAVIAGQCKNTC